MESALVGVSFLLTVVLSTFHGASAGAPIGISLAALGGHPTSGKDHGAANTVVFLDLMKHATAFRRFQPEWEKFVTDPGVWGAEYTSSRLPTFAEDGYPISLYNDGTIRTTVKATIGLGGDQVPKGRFICTHDGTGTLAFGGDAELVSSDLVARRYVVNVSPSSGAVIRILTTDAANRLHNIRLVPEAYEGDFETVFHPDFLARLKGFDVIVFDGWFLMDDNSYNSNTGARLWSQRPLVNQSSQNCATSGGGRSDLYGCAPGVAVEYAVQLCNELRLSPWLTMPDVMGLDDSFASGVAKMMHRDLDPLLGVYVQHRGVAKGYGNFDEQRTNSLVLWDIFGSAFNNTRSLNRIVAGEYLTESLSRLDDDVKSMRNSWPGKTFVTVPVLLGEQCSENNGCVAFNSIKAADVYANYSVEELLDHVQAAVLYEEFSWLQKFAKINSYTGTDAGVFGVLQQGHLSAMGFGWRDAESRLSRCINTRRTATRLKDRYRVMKRSFESGEAYYASLGFACSSWETPASEMTIIDGTFTASQCEFSCTAAGNFSMCGGFEHTLSTGQCKLMLHPNSANISPDSNVNCYVRAEWFRSQLETYEQLPSDASLAATFQNDHFCSTLETTYTSYFSLDDDPWSFDDAESESVAAELARLKVLEQSLEDRLMLAVNSTRFEAIMTDMLVRWTRIAGNSTGIVSGIPDVGLWNRLEGGGKGGGASSMLQSPHNAQDSPMWRAFFNLQNNTISSPADVFAFRKHGLSPQARIKEFTSDDSEARVVLSCAPRCGNGTCINGTCACWRGYSGPLCLDVATGAGDSAPWACSKSSNTTIFGANPSGLSYWSRQAAFVDMMKSASEWIPQTHSSYTWDTGETIEFGSNDGYPLELGVDQAAGTLMLRDVEKHAEDGVYVVRWDGDGVLSCSLNIKSTVRFAGRMECTMKFTTDFNNGLFVRVEWTNPGNPVRNVRVFMPGFDEGVTVNPETPTALGPWPSMPFHPHILRFLEPFPVLRWMDWMQANSYSSGNFDDRPLSSSRRFWGEGGVPLEHIILLSNHLGSAPYFNLPVRADDDYAEKFATLVRDQLRGDVDIFVELANENWHTGFDGGTYAQAQADIMDGAVSGSRFCWTVQRTKNISDIWHGVFPASQHSRLKFVLSSQESNDDATSQILNCADTAAVHGPTGGRLIYGVATAAYFDPPVTTGGAAAVLESLWGGLDSTLAGLRAHADLVRAAGFAYLVYEAGPAGIGSGDDDDAVIAAHRNESMRAFQTEAYRRLRDEVRPAVVLHFGTITAASRYGSWHLAESYKQDLGTAPKYLSLVDILTEAREGLPSDEGCSALSPDHPACAGADACGGNGLCAARNGFAGGESTCLCFLGFAGADCEEGSYVDYSTCGYHCTFNRGECVVDRIKGIERHSACDCGEDGYYGRSCARWTCADDCGWNGECVDQDVCHCFPGFRGEACEEDCGCAGHGRCGGGGCVCDEGYVFEGGACAPDQASALAPEAAACAPACAYGTCVGGRCECWAGWSGEGCASPLGWRPNLGSPVGMNVAGVGYGLNAVFADAMKHSSALVSVPGKDLAGTVLYPGKEQHVWEDGQAVLEAADGTVIDLQRAVLSSGRAVATQEVVALTLRDLCLRGTDGVYVVLFDGCGR